jgi:hypothetical protein
VSTPILHAPRATESQAAVWASSKGAPSYWLTLIPTFWRVAQSVGVDPAVAFAQSCKETAFGLFGGVIDATYHNPAGIKRAVGGGNYDPNAHMRFASWAEGIAAFVHHLALYAGASGFPLAVTPDPRHFASLLGTAPSVEDLGGKWAPNSAYGHEVVAMVREMSGEQESAMVGDSPLVTSFLQARFFGGDNGTVTRIVVHDEEYAEGPNSAEQIAQYFHTMPDGRKASATYVVDRDSIVQCVRESRIAYHAPPNAGSIGIEHDGYMHQTRAEWLDAENGVLTLKRSAALVADICKRHAIPVVRLSVADLKAGKRGLCGHVDVSNAWHQTDHGDPGPNFPWDVYLGWVTQAANGEELPVDQDKFNALMDAYYTDAKTKGGQVWKALFSKLAVGPNGEKQDVELDTIVKAVAKQQGIDVTAAVKAYLGGS